MTSNDANNSTAVDSLQEEVLPHEKNFTDGVTSEVDSVMTTVETRLHDAVLTAIESLVVFRIELAMKKVNASSARDIDSVVSDPDQRDFSGKIDGLQMDASARKNSKTDLKKIDETRGIFTVEVGDLSVNERNFG